MSLEYGRSVLRHEADAINVTADLLDDTFITAVKWILECKGRTITCGIGKSGHIAVKTAGTLSSTGTPSLFVHAADAVHGDLGMVTKRDILMLYTHSGETDEIVRLFPAIHAIGARTILVTGRPNSSAGRLSDLCLDTHVQKEACPFNLAPTTSATAMLALSDALSLTVMHLRNFTKEDYARFHPSGALGKRLLLRVPDVMRSGADLPFVKPDAKVIDVMKAIGVAGAGGACVVDEEQHLLGFISDGDLRRHFVTSPTPLVGTAEQVMTRNVTTISAELLAVEALEAFQNLPKKIGDMPVIDNGKVVGLLMLKDLLRCGIVA
jgi:arabinose-5-phosphate isomerase